MSNERDNRNADVELVRCEVTGREVPLDETVVFGGRRVSAEGKQLLADRINAGEALPGELEDAGRWQRLAAGVVDVLILFALLLAALAAVPGGLAAFFDEIHSPVEAAVMLPCTLLGFAYYGFTQARTGQTLGKRLVGIRVVLLRGAPVSARAAWGRSAVYVLGGALTPAAVLLLGGPSPAAVVLDVVVGAFGVIDLLLVFGPARRCLHDYVAGTRVVRAGSED